MIGLSRRWLRQISYAAILLAFASSLLLIANKNRLIVLEKYIAPDLVPNYFQPPSDSYVIDLAVESCLLVNKNSATCGLPSNKAGKYSDLPDATNWTRVDKDLLLGLSWIRTAHLLAKKLQPEVQEQENRDVVVDVWVGIPSVDCAVAKNTECIPKKILEDIHRGRIFGDEEYAKLQEESKDMGQVQGDKEKSAEAYYEKYNLEKAEKEKEKNRAAELAAQDSADAEAKELEKAAKDQKTQDAEKSNEKSNEKSPESASEEEPKKSQDLASKNSQEEAETGSNSDPETPKDSDAAKTEGNTEKKEPPSKRGKEDSRHELQGYLLIPTASELEASGWKKLKHGIWVKYGPASHSAVTGVDVLFGPDAVDPRPGWTILPHPLTMKGPNTGQEPRLTIRRGQKIDYSGKKYRPTLKFGSEGKLKILQVADLHFATGVGKCRDPVPAETAEGCEADPRTLRFIEKVLDLESPDFVVMTGDQVFGDAAPDPETALFKAVQPFVEREIPYAIIMGNHDDESVMLREQMMLLAASLPYSLSAVGLPEVDGFGNYAVTVESGWRKSIDAIFYFMDSHSRLKKASEFSGYDWLKDSQLEWVQLEAASLMDEAKKKPEDLLSMAFFHIPIQDFGDTAGKPMVGKALEGVASTKRFTHVRKALHNAGVQVVGAGHDHANDYCLFDATDKEDTTDFRSLWLCYGGGVGEGGYGGYGGYIRRMRVYELDSQKKTIRTWKRGENNAAQVFDEQTLVSDGESLNTN